MFNQISWDFMGFAVYSIFKYDLTGFHGIY